MSASRPSELPSRQPSTSYRKKPSVAAHPKRLKERHSLEVLEGRIAPAAIRVAVVAGGTGASPTADNTGRQAIVDQLNNDTYYDFDASLVAIVNADSVGELNAYDVVIVGDSGNLDNSFASYSNRLAQYATNAGGNPVIVVGTGLTGAVAGSSAVISDFDTILPFGVAAGATLSTAGAGTITITGTSHPITAGVSNFTPTKIVEAANGAVDTGATVLATSSGGKPTVAFGPVGTNGLGIYLGAGYASGGSNYDSSLRTGDGDRLLEQAVYWAYTQYAAAATGTLSATLSSGNLTIADIDLIGKDNALTVTVSGTSLVITDAVEAFTAAPTGGTLSNSNRTLTIPLASITAGLTINTVGGNDTVTLSFGTGDVIPTGNLTFNGGTGGLDTLAMAGGSHGSVIYNYTNSTDGSIVTSSYGTVTYTGLDPIINSGSSTDITFNLPASANAVTLGDDGTSGNTLSRISGANFELTDFANPTGSITINRGTASDTVTITALPDFNASLTIGSAASPFAGVTSSANLTLGVGKNLSIETAGSISLTGVITVPGSTTLGAGSANTISLANASNALNTVLIKSASTATVRDDGGFDLGTSNVSTLLSLQSSGAITQSGVLSGTGAITKLGAGTLTLSAANLYSGGTNVTAGTVSVSSDSNLGTGNIILDNATLAITGGVLFNSSKNITLASGAITGNVDVSNTAGARFTGSLSGGGSGATFAKTNSGTLTLTGSSTFTSGTHLYVRSGGVVIDGGSVTANGTSQSIGLQAGDVASLTIQNGGSFSTDSDLNLGELGGSGAITISGAASTLNAGNLYVGKGNGVTAGTGILTVNSGTVTVASGSAVGVTLGSSSGTSSGTVNLNGGSIVTPLVARGTGTGAFLFNGGTLKANASNATFFTGLTSATVSTGGAFVDDQGNSITIGQTLLHDAALGSTQDGGFSKLGSGVVTLSGANTYTGATAVNAGSLFLGSSGVIPDGTNVGSVTIASGAILDLRGFSETINGLSGAGFVDNSSGGATLTLGNGNSTASFSGVLRNTGGTLTLSKVGTGTQTLSGTTANTYSGNTTILDGTLLLQKTAGVNAISGNITIGDGTNNDVLQLGASNQIADTAILSFTSGGSGNSAKFTLGGFDETVGGIQSAAAGQLPIIQAFESGGSAVTSTLTVSNSANFAFDGTIRNAGSGSGTLALAKSGTGTLGLAATNASAGITYTGATTLSAGRLSLNNLTSFESVVTNSSASADALTFDQTSNALTVSTAIGGTGALTKSGSASLTLAGANSYTGATTVNAGALLVNGSIGTSAAAVNSGAMLGGSGTISGTTTVNTGGRITGGTDGVVGTLTLANLVFNGGTYRADLVGAAADQLVVNGTLNFNGGTQGVFALNNAAAGVSGGTAFRFIDLTSAGTASSAPLSGAAEGATVTVDSKTARFTYLGGTGNDFTLIVDGVYAATGTGVDDAVEIRRQIGGGADLIQTFINGSMVDARPTAGVLGIVVNTLAGNDSLFLNYGVSGVFNVPVTYNGGTHTTGDNLTVGGATFTNVTHTYGSTGLGTIDMDGLLVTFTGVEPIVDSLAATNRIFTFNGGAESITLTDAAGANMTLDSSLMEYVTFANPASSLTINAGNGNDAIAITSLDAAFNGALTIAGGTETDDIAFGAGPFSLSTLTTTSETIGALPAMAIGAGGLSITSTSSSITQSGVISVAGTATFAVGSANSITLGGANNFSTLVVNLANNVSINDTTALVLGASTISGAFNVTTAGAITQSGALTVTGATALAAGSSNNITLGGANNFSTLSVTSGNNVSINDTSALILGASTVSGTLDVTTVGAMTQSGDLAVIGAATFAAGTGNDITLGGANNFSTVSVTSGNNVSINDTNALILGASTVSGTLGVTAGGALTQSGALSVTGAATFAAGSNDITLIAANNFSSFSVTAGNNVSVNDVNSLALGSSTVSGNLTVTTVGAITQSGAVTVSGTSTFTSGAAPIALGNGGNNFVGAVSLNNSGANAVSITDQNALVLGTISVGTSTFDATAGGGITQTGTITQSAAAGSVNFTGGAGAIVLTLANDFTGAVNASTTGANDISISDGAGDFSIGLLTATGRTVTLSSTAGQLMDANAGNNVTASTLNVSAVSGIGVSGAFGAIETTVSTLKAITSIGGVAILNTGALTVADTGAFATAGGAVVTGASGGVSIQASGALTIAANVTAPGVILMSAGETASLTDNLVISNAVLVQSAGASVTLQAGDDIVLSGGINPQVSAATTATLTAATSNGGVLSVNGGVSAGGLITLSANGTVTLNASVASSAGNLAYTSATGAITRVSGLSSGNLLTGSAATGITLTTDVTTLNLTNSTSGNITVSEANAVDLAQARTLGGNGSVAISNIGSSTDIHITGPVSANGSGGINLLAEGELFLADTILGDDVLSGTGLISLRANAGVHIGNAQVTTGGNVSIDADANVAANTGPVTTGASGLISAANLTVYAAEGIALNTSVSTLAATNTFSGAIIINESNGLALNLVSNPGRSVAITLAGGALTDNNDVANNLDAASATLTAMTGIGAADAIETSLFNLEAQTASGAINISESDSLTIGGAGALAGISAGGAITVTSGALTITENITTTSTVSLTSTGSITEVGGGVRSASLLTTSSIGGQLLNGNNTVVAFDATNGLLGDVVFGNTATALTVVRIANVIGDVTLTNSGSVALGDSSNQGITVGNIATITATAGAITDGNGTANNISAVSAILNAGTGIGAANPIETAVANLQATAGNGGVAIGETDALNVNGISATGGTISITSGALQILGAIQTPGNVTLVSSGAINEVGGTISGAVLNTASVSGQTLNGANTVATFTATNTGSASGIVLENARAGFTISTVTNATGGEVFIHNTGTGATISGVITSGSPTAGGDITVQTAGLLKVDGVADSRSGTGGTLTLGGLIQLNASPIVGFGDVTLQGGVGVLTISAPITVSNSLVLQSTEDVNILARVETTSSVANLTVIADSDLNGTGGVYLGAGSGAHQGLLKSAGNLEIRGSEYAGTHVSTLGNLDNSIIIQSNGVNPRVEAIGNILLKNSASATSRIWLGGFVHSSTNGDVVFDNDVLVTGNDAKVQTHSSGDVVFLGAVDSASGGTSPYNLRVNGGTGVVLFTGVVGGSAPLGDVTIESALDLTIEAVFNSRSLTVTEATGTVDVSGAVSVTGTGTSLSINAVSLIVDAPIIADNTGNILLQVNNVAIGAGVEGGGTLTFQPRDLSRSIGLNAAGDLNLGATEIGYLQDGFSAIYIGNALGNGVINIGSRTNGDSWLDPVIFRAPAASGQINLLGQIDATGNGAFQLTAPRVSVNVGTAQAMTTEGGAVGIGLFTTPSIITLLSDLEIETGGSGAVNIIGTIDGNFALDIQAGTGAVYLNGNTTPVPTGTSLGGTTPLASVNVSGGVVTLRPNIRTNGPQSFSGSDIDLLGGDFRSLGDGIGTISFAGPVTLHNGIVLATNNSDVSFNGSVDNVASHLSTAGRGTVGVAAGYGTVTFGGTVGSAFAPKSISVSSAARVVLGNDSGDTFVGGTSVTLYTNELDMSGDVSVPGGTLTIMTRDAVTEIVIGGEEGVSTDLVLSDDDILALGNGTASIVIGHRSGTAPITIAATATFNDPVTLQQTGASAGAILVNAELIGATPNGGFTFNGPQTRLNADITTAGGAVNIEKVVVQSNSTITTNGGNVTFRGAMLGYVGGENLDVEAGSGVIHLNTGVNTPTTAKLLGLVSLDSSGNIRIDRGLTVGALDVDGGGTTYLRGLITTTTSAGQTYHNPVQLAGTAETRSVHAAGDLHFMGTVDSDLSQPTKRYNLTVTNRALPAAGVTARFEGAIGGSQMLGVFRVNTVGDALFDVGADVAATSVALAARNFTVQDISTSNAQTYTGIGVFKGVINTLKLTITSTADIVSQAAWNVTQLATLTAKNASIEIGEPGNHFGELILRGINATVVEDGDMKIRATSLLGKLDVTTEQDGSEAGNITQGIGRTSAFRLEAHAAGSLLMTRVDTKLTEVGAVWAGADLSLVVRGARYVLLDGDVTAGGNILLVANPSGIPHSFRTGGDAITMTAGGTWTVYSAYAQYATDGTDLLTDLTGRTASEPGIAYPDPTLATGNILAYSKLYR